MNDIISVTQWFYIMDNCKSLKIKMVLFECKIQLLVVFLRLNSIGSDRQKQYIEMSLILSKVTSISYILVIHSYNTDDASLKE